MGAKRSGADGLDLTGDKPATFETVRKGGYRPEQVDTTVRALRRQLEMSEHARRSAEDRAADLSASLEVARAAGAGDSFGMRAEKIIRLAEHEAGQRRERAEAQARELLEAARAEAGRIRDEAEQSASQVLAEAGAARRDNDLCADAAVAMREHVLGLRGAVRGEIARLHAAMGAELRALDEPLPLPEIRTGQPDGGPAGVTAPAADAATGEQPADDDAEPAARARTGPEPTPPRGRPMVSLPAQRPSPTEDGAPAPDLAGRG